MTIMIFWLVSVYFKRMCVIEKLKLYFFMTAAITIVNSLHTSVLLVLPSYIVELVIAFSC